MIATRVETLPDGRALRTARWGVSTDAAPVVLLHGYPDNIMIWSRLAPLLAQRAEVIAFDWPGMGDSSAWPGGTTPAHQAERLLALLDHWGIAKAGIIGMDMGGQPALVFAATHPGRTQHLTVMNSLVMGDGPTSWDIGLLRKYGWNRWLLRHMPGLVFNRAVRTSLPWGETLPEVVRSDMWRCFARTEVRVFITRLCAGYQGTLKALPDFYRRIACPTLLLWGGQDAHFPPMQGQQLHAVIPGSKLRILPRGMHWMAWHLAEEVAEAISEFTRRH